MYSLSFIGMPSPRMMHPVKILLICLFYMFNIGCLALAIPFLALTTMFTLGGYPLCSAVQLESWSCSDELSLYFPHCILFLFSALLSIFHMVYSAACVIAFVLAPLLAYALLCVFTTYLLHSLICFIGPRFGHFSLALLLLEHTVSQLFPTFVCLFHSGTFHACAKLSLTQCILASVMTLGHNTSHSLSRHIVSFLSFFST